MSDDEPDVPVSIDWASAQVRDGTLGVDVAGDASSDWAARVQAVADRLRSGNDRWGDVDVTQERITVGDVTRGSEADIRLLLEGAAQQANADLAPGAAPSGDDHADEADRAMTEAFRSFADG